MVLAKILYVCLTATAATSSSFGRISGIGPNGVILCGICQQVNNMGSQRKGSTYKGIDLPMTFSIMLFDMLKLRRLSKRRYVPVQRPDPLVKRRITGPDIPQICLEMLDIHSIEADNRGVKTNIGLCDLVPEVIWTWTSGQMLFNTIKRGEECSHSFLICLLRRRKT